MRSWWIPGGALIAALAFTPASPEDASLACTSAGHSYKVGEYACIPACHGRQRYARCDAAATAASWTFISDVCPVAALTPALPQGVSPAPVATEMPPIPIIVNFSPIAPELEPRIAAAHPA